MTIAQLYSVLRGRWRTVVAAMLAVALLAALASLLMTKKYTASAAVLIDSRGIDALGNPTERFQTSNVGLVATQMDVIRSERVARRVVSKLGLESDTELLSNRDSDEQPEGDIQAYVAQLLLKKLDVQPTRDSSVVRISYTSRDAKRAAAVVNEIAAAYVATNLELKAEPSSQYAGWFEERTRGLRSNLEGAQGRLIAFQRQHGLISTSTAGGLAQTDIETTKLSQLTAQLLEVQAVRVDTTSRQTQATRDASTSADVLASPVITDLRTKITAAQSRVEQLRLRYGSNFPEVITAQEDLATLERQLRTQLQSSARTVSATNAITERREAELRAAVQAQRERVMVLSRATNELQVLQRDVENAQRALDEAAQRQSQAALQSQLLQVNVLQLTPAAVPVVPTSPRLLLNLAIGLVLGLVVGILLALVREFRSPTIRSADDLALTMDLPILGVIGDVRRASRGSLPGLAFDGAASA